MWEAPFIFIASNTVMNLLQEYLNVAKFKVTVLHSYSRLRNEHFDIWNASRCHHIQELETFSMFRFFGPPCKNTVVKTSQYGKS